MWGLLYKCWKSAMSRGLIDMLLRLLLASPQLHRGSGAMPSLGFMGVCVTLKKSGVKKSPQNRAGDATDRPWLLKFMFMYD